MSLSLPDQLPADARQASERAAVAQERLNIWLDAELAATRSELELADRGRQVAGSYGISGPALLDQQA